MFIELTEALRCPAAHGESYLVCVPVTMDGRRVVRGVLGCPECHAEYPIIESIAHFGGAGAPQGGGVVAEASPSALTAEAVQTFLDLQGSGGYVVLVGDAGRLGPDLARLLVGVHVVGVTPPEDVRPTDGFSVLRSPGALPVKRHSMRGAVVGRDAAGEPWLSAVVGAVLPGLRLVVEDEGAAPEGVVELARGAGVFVGEKRAQ